MGNKLYKINPTGSEETVISLQDLGLTSTLGGFGFFRNGDLLVATDSVDVSLGEQLSIYNREEN